LGVQPLGIGAERDGVIYAPSGYDPGRPAPLLLMLHGSGGTARRSLPSLLPLADEHGVLLLAVDSRERTWDVVLGQYGPDVAFIDDALALAFSRYAIDPRRVAAEGFSDGASYALALGLSNGDLFTHVLAFSPGFVPRVENEGVPRFFISHGTGDPVLPIDQCSRRIVPELERLRYDVRYVEFDGGHDVPTAIAQEGLGWFLGG
jgi:predicted esterase